MREPDDQISPLDQHPCERGDKTKQPEVNADRMVGGERDAEPGSPPRDRGSFGAPPQDRPEYYQQAKNVGGDLNDHNANLRGLRRQARVGNQVRMKLVNIANDLLGGRGTNDSPKDTAV